jgi:NAD(P)-dependent dehydrogenase (short-subunit alcohol dehydrogenase family)
MITVEIIKMTNKQTILITGATGNVGGGAAVALAKRGARVVLFGRKLERLEARANSIRIALSEARIECQDTDITTLVVDFSDMESVRLAAAEVLNQFGDFCMSPDGVQSRKLSRGTAYYQTRILSGSQKRQLPHSPEVVRRKFIGFI